MKTEAFQLKGLHKMLKMCQIILYQNTVISIEPFLKRNEIKFMHFLGKWKKLSKCRYISIRHFWKRKVQIFTL